MERDRFVFVCLHSVLKVSASVDSGLQPQGVNQHWGADIYRRAPITAVCKTGVNLLKDPEQTVRFSHPISTPARKRLAHLFRHAYVKFLTLNVSCRIRISYVQACLLPLAGTVRVHTLIYVDWLSSELVLFGLRRMILYGSSSCKVIE